MNVLVIVGSDLSINTSANLCHKAYIQGLLENHCSVDVLTVRNCALKSTLGFAENADVRFFGFEMESLYEKIGKLIARKNTTPKSTSTSNTDAASSSRKRFLHSVKRWVHSLYGPYEVYISWKRKAMRFRSNIEYDLTISLSFPPVSHLLAHDLISKKHIRTHRWIQIWEDPWCQDLVFRSLNEEKAICKAKAEEARLLRFADEILYVSPITLAYQVEMFGEASDKMHWMPVPTYYVNAMPQTVTLGKTFGYFGDYSTQIRNLQPFYEAAKKQNATVNICGFSDKMFESCGNITVKPRISLEELQPIESHTNVLVFLSNLHGGQIPGKIYQYAATQKEILFILDGSDVEIQALKQFFGKFNRFIFCNNTVEDISKAIRKIEANETGGVSNHPLACFSPANIVYKILNHLEV